MGTRVVSFHSSLPATEQAVRTAIAGALPALGEQTPKFGIILAAHQHPLNRVLAAARAALPNTDIVVAWAINGFTERGANSGGIVGMLFASTEFVHLMTAANRISDDVPGAAKSLARSFSEWEETGKKQRLARSMTLLFVDGLANTREPLIEEVRKGTRPFQPIAGCGTTDDGAFKCCQIGTSRAGVARDSAAAIHVFSSRNWSIGVEHGHRPTSGAMVATKSSGTLLNEIDGRPAIEAYRQHAAKRGASIATPDALRAYMVQYPLGVFFYDDLARIRTPFAALPDGALVCGGLIPQGARICILGASKNELVGAAAAAAESAKAGLESEPAGVIVFSCFGRAQTLGSQQIDEVDAVRKVFPSVPMIGLSSYGEIARHRGTLDGYHNNTVVVAAVPS